MERSRVNFTNILRAAFSYKSFCHAFLYSKIKFVLFCAKILVQKLQENVGEIDTYGQFHQLSTGSFIARKFMPILLEHSVERIL